MTINLPKTKSYLIAVSGGVDSMVLCDLLLRHGYNFSVAHCNFGLREKESDADEQLVTQWCDTHQVKIFVKKFDTQLYAEQQHLSIQLAARELRYDFFRKLCEAHSINYILTAHHQDDNIETVFFHFVRGTGIQGLTGIPFQNENVMRPLLSFTKKEILQYAEENNIIFREDSSNQKNTYTRNKIRNAILPAIEEFLPTVKQNIVQNIQRLSEANEIYNQRIAQCQKKLIELRGKDFYIPILKLKNITPLNTVLYELLKPFDFSYEQAQQAIMIMDSEAGRKIETQNYRLLKDRRFFIISKKETTVTDILYIDEDTTQIETSDALWNIRCVAADKHKIIVDKSVIQVDASQLEFPLILRRWRQGDYMYPLGMKKKKKIARILIDEKVPLHEKENIWVVESNKKIICVAGIKTDERFKVTDKTKRIFILQKNR